MMGKNKKKKKKNHQSTYDEFVGNYHMLGCEDYEDDSDRDCFLSNDIADDKDFYVKALEESFDRLACKDNEIDAKDSSVHDDVILRWQEAETEKISEDISKETKKISAGAEIGFVTLAEEVIEENHLLCHNNLLYHFDGYCYSRLNEKMAMKMIFDKMSEQQKEDYWLLKNAKNIKEYIQNNSEIDLQVNEQEPSREVVTLLNGNLNLRTGVFFGHTANVITTYTVQAKYQQGRAALATPCWDKFILSAIDGDPEEIFEFVYAVLGYLLSPALMAKKFFVFGTAPDSGKSVVGNLLEELLKTENLSFLPLDEFGGRFNLAVLVGKCLNLCMDLPDKAIPATAVSRIKQLTGRDALTVEKKYQHPFEYSNECKLIFGTNSPIRLTAKNEAFFNRMIIIPFMHSVPREEQDTELLEKLLSERDAIVTKALNAAIKLYQRDFKFPTLTASEKMLKEWSQMTTHSVKYFMERCCMKTVEKNDFVTTGKAYQAYGDFCEDYDFKIADIKEFTKIMKEVFPRGRISITDEFGRVQPRGFHNIKLLV